MKEPPAPDDSLERCLAALLDAADAAQVLGIGTERVRAVHTDAIGRLGFPSDTYVLALVGGTGVGKSSLLNALAGASVSTASARRPTTDVPVAWIPAEERKELDPLLAWLDVREVREHDHASLRSVAILDLPDIDSVAAAHRERVEALLPRVDGVAWVTDHEKYHDAVLHDDFLRAWLPRLDRQAILLNKADRLAPTDRDTLRRDLARDADRAVAASARPAIPVLVTAAVPSDGAAPDVGELQGWLADGVAAKTIVRERLAATVTNLAAARWKRQRLPSSARSTCPASSARPSRRLEPEPAPAAPARWAS